MKVIDLLNKIANEEEVPKKIKYKNKIFEWKEYDVCYGKTMTKKGWVKESGYVAEENRTYFYLKHCYQGLNDEVECLDKLHLYYYVDNRVEEETGEITFNNLCDIIGNQRIHEDKINELEKRIEELEKK